MLWDDPFCAGAGSAGATSTGGSSCNMLRRVKRAVGIFMVIIVSYPARQPEIIGYASFGHEGDSVEARAISNIDHLGHGAEVNSASSR